MRLTITAALAATGLIVVVAVVLALFRSPRGFADLSEFLARANAAGFQPAHGLDRASTEEVSGQRIRPVRLHRAVQRPAEFLDVYVDEHTERVRGFGFSVVASESYEGGAIPLEPTLDWTREGLHAAKTFLVPIEHVLTGRESVSMGDGETVRSSRHQGLHVFEFERISIGFDETHFVKSYLVVDGEWADGMK